MSNELYHYGVPGMKWGVRRGRRKQGTKSASANSRRALKIGAVIAVAALATYGASKVVTSSNGQALVNQLLKKHNTTTLNIGKKLTNDGRRMRAIRPDDKFVSGYQRNGSFAPRSGGVKRVSRQQERNAINEKKRTGSTKISDAMQRTQAKAASRRFDRMIDYLDKGIFSKEDLKRYKHKH